LNNLHELVVITSELSAPQRSSKANTEGFAFAAGSCTQAATDTTHVSAGSKLYMSDEKLVACQLSYFNDGNE
jgi:hypothetical protein